jgi:hypothetical protein
MPALSRFAASVDVETAFSVLAVAKQLMAAGKDVIERQSVFHAAQGDRGRHPGYSRRP